MVRFFKWDILILIKIFKQSLARETMAPKFEDLRSMPPGERVDALSSLKRSQLQAVAKKCGIKVINMLKFMNSRWEFKMEEAYELFDISTCRQTFAI